MIRVLSDRVAVEHLPKKPVKGDVVVTNVTKSSANQAFTHAKVVSIGPDALGMNGVLLHEEVLVSEHFGEEVEIKIDRDTRVTLYVGRLRDIVGVFRPDGLTARCNRVILEKIEPDKTVGGILLPENLRFPNIEARVLSAGPDAAGVQQGDRAVLVKEGTGVVTRWNGRQFMWASVDDLLAVIAGANRPVEAIKP